MDPKTFNWRRMRNIQKIHRFLYALGLGPLIGKIILLLTTTGRKSGLARVTPCNTRKFKANIIWAPRADCRPIGSEHPDRSARLGVGQTAQVRRHRRAYQYNPARIADFLELRLERHPLMIGLIMQKAHGLPRRPSRAQLEALAAEEVVIEITPDEGEML
jgi:hypothetical protein